MGIQVEFNPDLALRNISEYNNGNRDVEECIPENIEINKEYNFLKKGQRIYWLMGEIPLLETKGNGNLSKPKASIVILEAVHFLKNGEIYTKGRYKVIEIYENDETALV
ncbi:MAG: hypothetical protein Q8P53_03265 [Candidatus Shapirobacteria bacterium]|nr:hypothetical protein [Candidatus Shapirobacteria bacterium]